MGYVTMLNFKIDSKNKKITGKYRSSNTFDVNGKRSVIKFDDNYHNEAKFKEAVFGWANDCLSGMARFSPSSTMTKRIAFLYQNKKLKLLEEFQGGVKWYGVEKDQETFDILTGSKHIKPKEWVIANDSKTAGAKFSRGYIYLKQGNQRTFTKYYSAERAEEKFAALKENAPEWVKLYNLKIVEL